MQTGSNAFDGISAKVVACAVIVVFLLLGLAGLILPLLPGLLFIAIAAIIAAKVSPKFGDLLRQNATLSAYLDRTDSFVALSWPKRIQVAALLLLKMTIDGVAWLVAAVMRVVRAAERV